MAGDAYADVRLQGGLIKSLYRSFKSQGTHITAINKHPSYNAELNVTFRRGPSDTHCAVYFQSACGESRRDVVLFRSHLERKKIPPKSGRVATPWLGMGGIIR